MRRFVIATFLMVLIPIRAFALVGFSSLLPNPAWDDTLGEYIELRNTGCASVDISWYTLSDLSWKSYTLPVGTNLNSHANKSFLYSETKIALNNSWNESVFLKDSNGITIDSYNYSGTQRDNVILTISLTDDSCAPPEGTNSGIEIPISTGTTNTGGETLPPEVITGALISTGTLAATGAMSTGTLESLTDTGSTENTGSVSGSGEISNTGGLTPETNESTNSWNTDSWMTNTGEISLPYVETDTLSPLEMYYSDSDGNSKIDTLEILYPYALTWWVNVNSIFLFSRTGGLSARKIDTASGHIHSWSLSGNILILKILEWDLEKTTLHITNSTTSDLRLKSSGDLWVRSIGWKIPEDFLLTKSFDEYRKVYTRSSSQIPTPAGMTGTGVVNSGTVSTDSISSSSGISFLFPEIIPTLQSPTNATLSWESFACTTIDCRINLTIEPIFSSGFAMREYQCYFSTGDILVFDTDCNPNTIYYTHSWILVIELREKAHTGNIMTKVFPIEWKVISTNSPANPLPPWVLDTGNPVAKMELDNKWKEYYFQDGEHSLICYTLTCSVNFTAEKSYDPEGSSIKFLWIYGHNDISTSKDPGGRKYGMGNHVITLRVIDGAGNYSEIDYHIHVVWPKPKEEKIKKEKIEKKKTKISASITPKKKKIKKIKMLFYSPPSIVLQGKSGEKNGIQSYICQAKTKNLCTINFTLSWTLRGYEYRWIVDGNEVYTGKNPKSWKLTPGTHEVRVMGYAKKSPNITSEEVFTIKVISEKKKAKKAKKKKVPKPKKTKPLTIIPELSASAENGESSSPSPLVLLIFWSGIGLGYFMRRRKI